MKDLMTSSRDSSPVRERAAMSFSTMKSLVLREKDEKLITEFGSDERVVSLIKSLVDAEGHVYQRKGDFGPGYLTSVSSLPKDIHGAPPESFVVKLSEAIGSLKTLRKMASFWCRVVAELRRLWLEGQYVPGIPEDKVPDLNSCLLYQQLQVINRCISRQKHRSVATESLDSTLKEATININKFTLSESVVPAESILYARISTGEIVLRSGADETFGNLTMLEIGQPVFTPVMQEAALLTEDLIKETEEFVLRTRRKGRKTEKLSIELYENMHFSSKKNAMISDYTANKHAQMTDLQIQSEANGTDKAEEEIVIEVDGHLPGECRNKVRGTNLSSKYHAEMEEAKRRANEAETKATNIQSQVLDQEKKIQQLTESQAETNQLLKALMGKLEGK